MKTWKKTAVGIGVVVGVFAIGFLGAALLDKDAVSDSLDGMEGGMDPLSQFLNDFYFAEYLDRFEGETNG